MAFYAGEFSEALGRTITCEAIATEAWRERLIKIGPNRPRPIIRTATLFGSRLWLQLREWDPAQGRGVPNLDAEGT